MMFLGMLRPHLKSKIFASQQSKIFPTLRCRPEHPSSACTILFVPRLELFVRRHPPFPVAYTQPLDLFTLILQPKWLLAKDRASYSTLSLLFISTIFIPPSLLLIFCTVLREANTSNPRLGCTLARTRFGWL